MSQLDKIFQASVEQDYNPHVEALIYSLNSHNALNDPQHYIVTGRLDNSLKTLLKIQNP